MGLRIARRRICSHNTRGCCRGAAAAAGLLGLIAGGADRQRRLQWRLGRHPAVHVAGGPHCHRLLQRADAVGGCKGGQAQCAKHDKCRQTMCDQFGVVVKLRARYVKSF